MLLAKHTIWKLSPIAWTLSLASEGKPKTSLNKTTTSIYHLLIFSWGVFHRLCPMLDGWMNPLFSRPLIRLLWDTTSWGHFLKILKASTIFPTKRAITLNSKYSRRYINLLIDIWFNIIFCASTNPQIRDSYV